MLKTNKYKIEQRVSALSYLAVMDEEYNPACFTVSDIKFSHWDFNHREGWLDDAWIAEAIISAERYHVASRIFNKKLQKIIPRASLITQGYIDFYNEPFLIHRLGSDVAFFRFSSEVRGVGLMFGEMEQRALEILVSTTSIPDAFFYYWNDAVNTTGYSSKLLLMFSALEALVKKNGKKDWKMIEGILGKELMTDLFGTEEKSNDALRNRLVHGEYFGGGDGKKNYFEMVHNKVVTFFNREIFKAKLLHENVTHPHRHFFGNKEECRSFVKSQSNTFALKDILSDFKNHGFRTPKNYDHVFDEELIKTY